MTTSPDEMLQQAAASARSGDPAEARRILSELVRQHPREARAWYLLSQLMEQPERAEYCLKKVLEIDPQNAKARQRLEAIRGGGRQAAPPSGPLAPPVSSAPPASAPAVPAPAPAQAVAPQATPPGQVKLPPWLAASPEQAAPLRTLVEPPAQSARVGSAAPNRNGMRAGETSGALAEREIIQGIPSTYKPPEIPGAIEEEAPAAPVKPAGTSKAAKKRKEKKDHFGLIWWVASILSLVCVCGAIAVCYGPQILMSRFSGGQLAVPGAETLSGGASVQPADSYRVKYKVEGRGAAQVVYTNSKGQSVSKFVYLPYTNTMTMSSGGRPYVSAQSGQGRYPHCAIEVNGTEVTRDTGNIFGLNACYVELP